MLKESFYSFLLRSLGAGLGFFLSVLLARLLSLEGFGEYYYVIAVIGIVAIPVQAGMPILVVRETARYKSSNELRKMSAMWRWSSSNAIRLSLVAIVVASIILGFSGIEGDTRLTWLLALLAIPITALCGIRAAQLRGLHRVLHGQFPEMVLRPLVFIIALILLKKVDIIITPWLAMALYLFSYFVSYLVGAAILRKSAPFNISNSLRDYTDKGGWWSGLIPLTLVSSLGTIVQQVDIILLGVLGTAEQVGVYRAAMAISILVAFGLSAVNAVMAPRFAGGYRSGDRRDLQKMVTLSVRLNVLIAVPVFLLLFFVGNQVLSFFFGPEFVVGAKSLVILALAQLVNAIFGPVALLLNMSGYEKITVKALAMAVVMNIFLNLALIPRMGMEGAALATLIGMIFWNFYLAIEVRRKLSVSTLAYFLRKGNE